MKPVNVMQTWMKFGFVPPTQVRNDYLFKFNRKVLWNELQTF